MAVDKFVKILVKHKIVTKEQVIDADKLAKKKNIKLADALAVKTPFCRWKWTVIR